MSSFDYARGARRDDHGPPPTYEQATRAGAFRDADGYDYTRPQSWRNLLPLEIDASKRQAPSSPPPMSQLSADMDAVRRRPGSASSSQSTQSSTDAAALFPRAASPPSTPLFPSAATASREHVDAAVDSMWDARRARELAEEEADRKLVEAVCKASLAEFNERQRALDSFDKAMAASESEKTAAASALQAARAESEARKRSAIQRVIDNKGRAREMSQKARLAAADFEQKSAERVGKELELEHKAQAERQAASLAAVQQKKDEAIRKREEAERRAREAREKAEEMRRRAFQAASKVRASSRKQIETQLSVEEEQRQRQAEHTLAAIEEEKAHARAKREQAARKAEEAQRRAAELRAKAEQARLALASRAPTSSA